MAWGWDLRFMGIGVSSDQRARIVLRTNKYEVMRGPTQCNIQKVSLCYLVRKVLGVAAKNHGSMCFQTFRLMDGA